MAEQLSLPDEVVEAIGAAYERWDGRGWPGELEGERDPARRRASRTSPSSSRSRTASAASTPSGSWRATGAAGDFDPALADLRRGRGRRHPVGARQRRRCGTRSSTPSRRSRWCSPASASTPRSLAIANFVDLKSPYFLGHARAVSELAAEAGRGCGLGEDEVRLLRRAGLVHGLGRLGISNAILDKPGPLGAGEWERVRLQPYLTDRMLRQSRGARARGPRSPCSTASGSTAPGYPRGLSGAAISREARILAAADAYQAMREPRPHRPARSADGGGRASCAPTSRPAATTPTPSRPCSAPPGHRVPRRREGPAGLTPREVEVLRLLARGLSNKEIAARLVISPKTVANHVEHIYAKIDASTRAAAGLFAMQHGLLPEEEFPARVAA